MKYKIGKPMQNNNNKFWIIASVLMGMLAILMALIALHCSKTLECLEVYKDNDKQYCISEIKR